MLSTGQLVSQSVSRLVGRSVGRLVSSTKWYIKVSLRVVSSVYGVDFMVKGIFN